MDTLLQDLRYSFRLLWKKPGFAAIVILTLALGIGANTAVFTVINALLLRPLPYPDADRLVFVWESRLSDPAMEDSLSPHNFTDIGQRARSLQSYFAFRYGTFNLTAGGQPEALSGVLASADFGRTMGITPAIGRMFGAAEDVPGRDRAVVLSDGLWKRRFGGDPQILGTQIRLNGELFSVLGVMPPDFRYPHPDVELWVPLALDLSKSKRGTSFLTSVARLKPGVTEEAASSEALQVGGQFRKDFPEVGPDFSLLMEPFREHLYGKMERPLMILFGSVALVLLIACVNVANLMLSRASSRSKEIAVRSALGASRASLIRLLLLEGLLLALLAGAAGILLAAYGIQILTSIYPAAIPASANLSMDIRVIGFTVLVSVMTGVLFALAPAWHAAQAGLNQTLQESGRAVSSARRVKLFRSALVVTEICLSLVLLVGAGLLLKSLWKELAVNPGFEAQNVVTCMISLPQSHYGDSSAQTAFFRRALDAMRDLPGVESAGFATSLPFSGSRGVSSFSIDGRPDVAGTNGPEADRHQVSPGYFG
ncbi:MAG TPA: ABC transporter permease, partial [Acidobacteriota bacterium]|nr:ABC transporter permease [Acidobacteriota bacterium]